METMLKLRAVVSGEVFDYQVLMHCLKEYKKPRDKVSQLLKKEAIIQMKRGVYIFGPDYRRDLPSLEVIAALLVQPSYISREYALHQYGLLSERVERVTSMTTRKKRHFETPLGVFDYYSLSLDKFAIGVEAREGYLFASKEKALADWIAGLPSIPNKEALEFFLYEESRIDPPTLKPLNQALLQEIAKPYQNRNVDLLLTI